MAARERSDAEYTAAPDGSRPGVAAAFGLGDDGMTRISRADAIWQRRALDGVARTFALTVRPLPGPLRDAVSNLYLLCRIADTIEDDPALSQGQRSAFARRLVRAVEGRDDAPSFARDLAPRLAGARSDRDLVAAAPRLLAITSGFDASVRDAMRRCVRIMAHGMVRSARDRGRGGLADLEALDRYCYVVAGVVGETLTALYVRASPAVARRRRGLDLRARSFGQGLQMVNILKDTWEDRRRGVCWLPRTVFQPHGVDLARLDAEAPPPGFAAGMADLVGITRGHLDDALDYVLRLPRREVGIRWSCLWPLALAVLTLRRIHRRPDFRSGAEVKISRRSVYGAVAVSSLLAGSNRALALLYRVLTRGLPWPPAPTGSSPAADRWPSGTANGGTGPDGRKRR